MVRLRIKKIGINGEGIGYHKGIPTFCDGALKDELVDINIIKDLSTYKIAKLNKIIEVSPSRREAKCPNYHNCTICPLMIMDRPTQLEIKKDLLKEALHKYAKINSKLIRNIHNDEELNYRNECKLPIKKINNQLVSGLYKPGSNTFIPIDSCLVHKKEIEIIRKDILKILNEYNIDAYNKKTKQGIRYIVIRHINNAQLTLITGSNTKIPKECIDDLAKIDGLDGIFQSINTTKNTPAIFGSKIKKLYGEDYIQLNIKDKILALSPAAFFQLNTFEAIKLYEMAISKIDECNILVEAYAGIGAMSLLASNKAKHIYAIENNADAINDGIKNNKLNNINNIEYILSDASDGLYKVARKNYIDILLVDPPRRGLDKKMIEAILDILPKKIIYVSCNPATLAKNLKILNNYYHIRTIIPYDLFPNTPLVESISVLELK